MYLISWNVNGIRACVKNGFVNFIEKMNPDIVCIQETKSTENTAKLNLKGYYSYWHSAEKKGYSGTCIFTKNKPLEVSFGIDNMFIDEGRVIVAEYSEFFLINCYAPHSKRDLKRLEYKHRFNCELIKLINALSAYKPIIICGDMNVAHRDIDLANYKSNKGNAGFTEIERNDFSSILDTNLVDSYRLFFPNQKGVYTWWSYMKDVRNRNIGWRIDYALVSSQLIGRVTAAEIYSDVLGSDHCPIGLRID